MRKTLFLLVLITFVFAYRYTIVVSEATYNISEWRRVVDSLQFKHQGQVFTWSSNVREVIPQLSSYLPDYICFVGRPVTEVNQSFVQTVHQLTRELDSDPYGDAVWGIITGYNADDALRVTRFDSLRIRTFLGGTNCTWGDWIRKGIATYEAVYNRIRFTFPNGQVLDTVWSERCPTDRCTLLVNYLNNGFNDTVSGFPRISGPVDIFVTSGHANVNEWQMHYPDPGSEGYFRSNAGTVYGDPYSGPDRNIDDPHPKVYFAVGNCLIGQVSDMNCMVLAWFHSGGAIQMTGYIVPTSYGYMLWGLPYYFHCLQNTYNHAQSFYFNNQALIFDRINSTPGTDPSGLDFDRNNVAFYGDPACDVRIDSIKEPYCSFNLETIPGGLRDTFILTVRANYDSACLGFGGVSYGRHPIYLLPFRVDSVEVETTNAYQAVITDNFVLLYVWYQGQRKFVRGEERFIRFTAKRFGVDVAESHKRLSFQFSILPNPSRKRTSFTYTLPKPGLLSLNTYDLQGRLIANVSENKLPGTYQIELPKDLKVGVYFVIAKFDGQIKKEKMVVMK
jgi:zinc protease